MLNWEKESLSRCSWAPSIVVYAVIIKLDWLRQEDHLFVANRGSIARPYLKK